MNNLTIAFLSLSALFFIYSAVKFIVNSSEQRKIVKQLMDLMK